MKNENIPIGSNAGVSTNQVCFAAWEEKEELIPCDDALKKLAEFLAEFNCGRAISPEMREALAED